MGPTEFEPVEPLIEEYMKRNPGVTVQVESVSFYQARAKFEQGVKAGVVPDVFRSDRFWLSDFIRAGMLEPLDKEFFKEELDDLLYIARTAVMVDDNLWAVPNAVDCLSLFYNKDHFKDAGVEPPVDFDSFRDAAAKLSNSGQGRYGFFLNPDGWWFEPFLYGFGGRFFDNSGKLSFNSEQSLKALHYLLDLKDTVKAVPPVNLRSNSYRLMIQSFKNGTVSMMFNGPWAVKEVLNGAQFKDKPDNLGICAIPKGPAGAFSPIGCQSFIIPKGSKNKVEAQNLIKFFCSEEYQTALRKAIYEIPARKSLFSDPGLKSEPLLNSFVQQLQSATKLDSPPERSRLYTLLADFLPRIYNGDINPEYALKDFESVWQKKQ